MPLHQPSRIASATRPSSLFRIFVAALCVFLVLLVGAAQLLHNHPADAPPDANCSLCVVAHLSAAPAPVVAGPAITAVLRAIPPPDSLHSTVGAAILAYSIRPPPALHPHA